MNWFTVQITTNQLRAYRTKADATTDTLALNESDPNHPAFYLWKLDGETLVYAGRLWRKFGEDFAPDPWQVSESKQ